MLQFPPTPWGVNDDGDVVDEGGDIVAINPRLGSFPAHLISQAPEMLALLEEIVRRYNPNTSRWARKALPVIASARGEQVSA